MDSQPDPFLGTWELDPATLDYQYVRPGRLAVYKVEPSVQGLNSILDADDADGKRMNVTYGGYLDGRDQPLPGADAALVLTRYDQNNIESTLKRGGKIVHRWTREVRGQTQMPCPANNLRADTSERIRQGPGRMLPESHRQGYGS